MIFSNNEKPEAAVEVVKVVEEAPSAAPKAQAPEELALDGTRYVIRFDQKRINMYEASHKPVMTTFIQNGGAFSAAELTALVAVGLMPEGGNYVNTKQAQEVADRMLGELGYTFLLEKSLEALERDCGFFFK